MKNKIIYKIKTIPKVFWFFLIICFILGYLIGNKNEPEIHNHGKTQNSKINIWTCSMHPQIKLPEAGQCPICFMDLIPLVSGEEETTGNRITMSENARKLAEIQTTRVIRKKVEKEILLSGKIDYDETNVYHISAWTGGRLDKLYADYTGLEVKKGDPLVEIYSPELFSVQQELIQIKRQYDIYKGQNNKLAKSSKITLEATREKLKLLGLKDNQIKQLENNSIPQKNITIPSTSSGVIIKKYFDEGMYVKTGMAIYEVVDLSQLWVMLYAYEKDLPFIQLGQKVEMKNKALPDESIIGRVDFISPIINEQTRSGKIRINIDNRQGKLKPGMFVQAKIYAKIDSNGKIVNPNKKHKNYPIVIPASAPLITGKRAVVFVKLTDKDEPTYETREIILGPAAGDYYIVLKGLKEGEYVVTSGNFKIDSAMQLEDKLSMMNQKIKKSDEKYPASKEFHTSLSQLYSSYFALRESLADDNFSKSKLNFKNIYQSVLKIQPDKKFDIDALLKWRSIGKQINESTQNYNNIENIKILRYNFEKISNAILDMEKYFGHSDSSIYYEAFCPMAFDNRGAPWLQNFKQIDNPYFGASMLRCGEIKKTMNPVNNEEKVDNE
jgi:Cu(I)/Ag(I) efflux system membrane fusion protein